MRVRPFALAAIILTAACSPDAGLGPTGGSTGTTTETSNKRSNPDSSQTCGGSAYTDGKRSCDTSRWNGSSGKR